MAVLASMASGAALRLRPVPAPRRRSMTSKKMEPMKENLRGGDSSGQGRREGRAEAGGCHLKWTSLDGRPSRPRLSCYVHHLAAHCCSRSKHTCGRCAQTALRRQPSETAAKEPGRALV